MADCPRKKAADSRKRQEKDRRERQEKEARSRTRSVGEQQPEREQGQERRRTRTEIPGTVLGHHEYTSKQQKIKLRSLEKLKRKSRTLSKEDEELLVVLKIKVEKEKKDSDDDKRKKLFEMAVKNAGAEVQYVGEASDTGKVTPKEKRKNRTDLMKQLKLKNKEESLTQEVDNMVQGLKLEDSPNKGKKFKKAAQTNTSSFLKFPTFPRQEDDTDEDDEVEVLSKPSVLESLQKIQIRKEMRKQASIIDAKSPKKSLWKRAQEEEHADTIKEFRKKQLRKERQDKEKDKKKSIKADEIVKQKIEKEQKKEAKLDQDIEDFDYNQVQATVVAPGTLNYFSPLPSKGKIVDILSETEDEEQKEQDNLAELNRSRLEESSQKKKERRKVKVKANRERKSDIKKDAGLLQIAENYLLIKSCHDAEVKANIMS